MAKIVGKAYGDAVMQGAYNAILPPEFKEKSDKTKKVVSERLAFALSVGVFEKDFDIIAAMDMVKGAYDKSVNGSAEFFSFGNAQKWVNMSVKYILVVFKLLSVINEKHEFCKIGKKYEDKKSQLDLPIDSCMLEKMWDIKEINIPVRAERNGRYSPDKVKPWSKWNKDDYIAFRESLHKAIDCPLDWEGPVWIEISEKRSKK